MDCPETAAVPAQSPKRFDVEPVDLMTRARVYSEDAYAVQGVQAQPSEASRLGGKRDRWPVPSSRWYQARLGHVPSSGVRVEGAILA
jgi:hypothetical protein